MRGLKLFASGFVRFFQIESIEILHTVDILSVFKSGEYQPPIEIKRNTGANESRMMLRE